MSTILPGPLERSHRRAHLRLHLHHQKFVGPEYMRNISSHSPKFIVWNGASLSDREQTLWV
jgi:hypothetical protein